jgi:hypothetical protein
MDEPWTVYGSGMVSASTTIRLVRPYCSTIPAIGRHFRRQGLGAPAFVAGSAFQKKVMRASRALGIADDLAVGPYLHRRHFHYQSRRPANVG